MGHLRSAFQPTCTIDHLVSGQVEPALADLDTAKLAAPRIPGAGKGANAETGGPGVLGERRDGCTFVMAPGNGRATEPPGPV